MRGQVTTFLVLGLVILIIIGFAVFISNFLLQNKANEQADLAFKEFEQSVSLNTYVRSCIRAATQEGLWLLGIQGGYIYQNQGGTQEQPSYTIPNVRPNLIGEQLVYNMSAWLDENNQTLDMPKLCSRTGPNRRGVSSEHPGCLLILSYGNEGDNIQDSLASFIDKKIPECLDLEEFTTRGGTTISAQDPSTELILNSDDMLINVAYPFEVHVLGKTPETKQANYTYKENTRLQRIYVNARQNIVKKSANHSYNIVQNYTYLNYWRPHIIFTVQEEFGNTEDANCQNVFSEYCDDDLVEIIDENSLIAGQEYKFMFGIRR